MNWNTKHPEEENFIDRSMLHSTLLATGYVSIVAPNQIALVAGTNVVALNLHSGYANHREVTAPIQVVSPTVPSQWIYYIRIR